MRLAKHLSFKTFIATLLQGLVFISLPALALGPLNDTGVEFCGSHPIGNTTAPCDPDPVGQDTQYGRDAADASAALTKVGDGGKGFDFTKFCNSGQQAGQGSCPSSPTPGDEANEWGCTRDNVTGLFWEVKTDDGSYRDKDATYSWYQGGTGTADGGTCSGGIDCDTENYVDLVNSIATIGTSGLCGQSTWRLPYRHELHSIVDYGQLTPAIDPTYFPNTQAGQYWTGSEYRDGYSSAWYVDFDTGVFKEHSYPVGRHVRLVYSPDAVDRCNSDTYYTVHGDGTVTDNRTGLMWKQCPEGLSGDECATGGEATSYFWEPGLQHAEGNSFGGYDDWRLPNIKELSSLLDECRVGASPIINTTIFPNVSSWTYMSSSPNADDELRVWGVYFLNGYNTTAERSGAFFRVRLVRDGQELDSFNRFPTQPGDINRDGKIDLSDVIHGLLVLAGQSVSPLAKEADIDGEGKIGLEELIYVLNKLATE